MLALYGGRRIPEVLKKKLILQALFIFIFVYLVIILTKALLSQVLVLGAEGESNEINEIDLESLKSKWIPDNVSAVWRKENTGGVKKDIHIISFIYIYICIYNYHSSRGSSVSGASARGRRRI